MKKLFTFISIIAVAGMLFSCDKGDDKNILDFSAEELDEALLVKMNDRVAMELKGNVKEYTEFEFYAAEMNGNTGTLAKNNATAKDVYTFNEAGFTTSIKEYQAAYDYSSGGYSTNLQLRNEQTATLNEHNQVVEIMEKDYNYDNPADVTPSDTYYSKTTYTYTATEATEISYYSDDAGQTWIFSRQSVYPLDEYGRIDWDNEKVYYAAPTADPVLRYENVEKRTKDEKGNTTSILSYQVSYNPTYYYFYQYTEFSYLYY